MLQLSGEYREEVTMWHMNNAQRVLSFSFSKIQMLISSLIFPSSVLFPAVTAPRDFAGAIWPPAKLAVPDGEWERERGLGAERKRKIS